LQLGASIYVRSVSGRDDPTGQQSRQLSPGQDITVFRQGLCDLASEFDEELRGGTERAFLQGREFAVRR
jgi:hypothetical protein